MGVDHDGGFSEYVRVPADWVVPLPQGLTLFEAMALGTAGFAAARSFLRFGKNTPGRAEATRWSRGGEALVWLTRTMQQNGVIASFGNAGGIELHTTVMPFILRGVRLIGIDSAATAMPLRRQIWQRLASDPSTGLRTGLHPKLLAQVAQIVPFSELPQIFPLMLQGKQRGRRGGQIKQPG